MGLFDWIELILDILEKPQRLPYRPNHYAALGGLSFAQTQKMNPSVQERATQSSP